MKRAITLLACGLACALVATPILGQRDFGRGGDRPSRQCVQEIVKLCGRDRSQIRSCLRQKADQLSAQCSSELRERVAQRRGAQNSEDGVAPRSQIRPFRTLFYGQHQRQQVDIYEPDGAVDDLPLVLFIHGGGWTAGNHKRVQTKSAHLTGADTYFASTGYRLVPEVSPIQQAEDIGAALRALRAQAVSIGFDADRIVIMGHSAGAHLAALVGTDPRFAGDAFEAIRGVILLDGAAYEIASSIAASGPRAADIYSAAFGYDEAEYPAFSPVSYVGAPDAPNWLALYAEGRARAKAQSELLANGLVAAGVEAEAVAIPDTDHIRMNREFGTEAGAAQTRAVDEFLTRVFG